jgi:membrane protein DedA with SNARE-associated domain
MSLKYYFKFLGPVSAFAVRHPSVGVFLSTFLGVIGLPLPVEGLLAYVGYQAYQGKVSILYALSVAILGGMVATLLGYGIVHIIGIAATKKHIRYFYPESATKAYLVSSFKRVGKWGLVFGYFLPVIRHLLGPLAAVLEFDFFDFLVLSSLGCTIWSATFFMIGGVAGKDWATFSPGLQHFLVGLSLFTVLLGLVFFFIKLRKFKNYHPKSSK